MAKRTYIGKIESGKLVLHSARRKQMEYDISRMKEGKLVQVEIRYLGRRSLQNNAYYWAVIVPLVKEALLDLGHDLDDELTHDFLKLNFNYQPLVSENAELIGRIPGSTTEMNTEEFMIYRERIKEWAAQSLNLYIPDPNEQTELNL